MKIIENLIEELTNKNNHLTDILIKTKVLAFKLKNIELITWIDNELNGYPKGDLPEYRCIKCQVIGTLSNGFQRVNNYPIPLGGFDKELYEMISTIRLDQSISTLDEFVHKDKGENLVINISPEFYGYLSKSFDNGYGIEFARRQINKAQVIQTLTIVKTKLLDFLLKLNEELGDTEDLKPLTEGKAKEKVSSLFNAAVFGNNTTIIVGDRNSQTVSIVMKGNFDSLSQLLKENGVEDKEINELKKIIDIDSPISDKREFGIRVKSWITRMLEKVMDSSWQIGLGAAGSLLADSIGNYYGWK